MKLVSCNVTQGFRNFNTRMGNDGRRLTLATATFYKNRVRARCPVKSRRLQNSLGNQFHPDGVWEVSKGGLRIRVGTRVPYAIPVEQGIQQAYKISAKGDGFLKFRWNNKIVYVKSVMHPPMKGKFFMKKAAIDTERNVPGIVNSI